ncbi:MAG: ATP-dependent DNA helicase RecG [Nitriliruptorales bacterium]
MTIALDDAVEVVRGVGAKSAAGLKSELGIETVRDLVEHYPRRYEDLGELTPVADAPLGEPVTLVGTVDTWSHRRSQKGRRLTISEATIRGGDGGTFVATFFNQRWRERQLPPGVVAAFSGTLEVRYKKRQMANPRFSQLGGEGHAEASPRLLPVYPAAEAVPTWRLQPWIESAIGDLPPVEDFLPEPFLDRHDLLDLDIAVRGIHLPEDRETAAAARRRLAFDELFTLQVGLQWRRARMEAEAAGLRNTPAREGVAARFLEVVPFEPTRAQRRAFGEIGSDLDGERPMHRLLQGDVGSGKTLVATWALLCAVDNGRQGALMAPTEVLAEQHHRTLTEQLAPLGVNVLDGIRVELLTSGTPTSSRRRIRGELLSGRVDLVVGTHALLEEGVRFAGLGVVVIDEQHRFGVHQRVRLKEKAKEEEAAGEPDVLVMTATPIPRSLALTLFGDLDVTVLDELPPGRKEIVTQLILPEQAKRRDRLYGFVREQAAAGFQTYVLCPLVEESEEVAARAAEAEHARLRDEVFPDLRVGLVHGRLRPDDKEAAMSSFRRGETDVLVATTVIEVGVDVPNATVMVIEDAERFGISQLHQLRGRVGRGAERSYCVLFAGWSGGELTEEARTRLEAVTATTDGFELAEVDLELRGAGELFGARQSGMPDLKLVKLGRDTTLIAETREAARELVADDPELRRPEFAALRSEVLRRYRGGLEQLEALATG